MSAPSFLFASLCWEWNDLTERWEQFRLLLVRLHGAVQRADVPVNDADRLAGIAGDVYKRQDKGFENTLFLADDGYSGTNFDRPSWKKIIEMIEAGEVSTLIVKDTSRLGREYLQVGSYMEIYFPQKNVRFIAVNDLSLIHIFRWKSV